MTRLFLTAAAAVYLLAATAAYAQDAAAAQNSVKLSRVYMSLPAGAQWLKLRYGDAICLTQPSIESWDGGRIEQKVSPFLPPFRTELQRAGYKVVTPGDDNLFDPDSGVADFEVAGVISDAHFDACMSVGGLFHERGSIHGEGAIKMDWQLYSPLKKQVVARVTTSGSVKLDHNISGGVPQLVTEAFAENARVLAANADFRAAMAAPSAPAGGAVLPGKQDKITLAGSLKAGKRPIADAVGSVVTVFSSLGSGSGNLISSDGYLLTNYHVVGDDKQVRVRWSDGIEKVADVIRVSKTRDVALIKTSARDREPLAIKRGAVSPGQRVYAIGSPLGQEFEGTVSAGIISATRTVDGMRLIQSDVAITHGSSGGALLDENGALIGVSVSGIEKVASINFFIPIGDAMDFLTLEPN